jgi:hypothetical protein
MRRTAKDPLRLSGLACLDGVLDHRDARFEDERVLMVGGCGEFV